MFSSRPSFISNLYDDLPKNLLIYLMKLCSSSPDCYSSGDEGKGSLATFNISKINLVEFHYQRTNSEFTRIMMNRCYLK